jgi:hypothetical protein
MFFSCYFSCRQLPSEYFSAFSSRRKVRQKNFSWVKTCSSHTYVNIVVHCRSFYNFDSRRWHASEHHRCMPLCCFNVNIRILQVFPTALSIMVSFLSAVTLLGTPSEIYLYGTMYCYQGIENERCSCRLSSICRITREPTATRDEPVRMRISLVSCSNEIIVY